MNQTEQIEKMEKQINTLEKAVRVLQHNVNLLMDNNEKGKRIDYLPKGENHPDATLESEE
jgi:archaellum component FlaC